MILLKNFLKKLMLIINKKLVGKNLQII